MKSTLRNPFETFSAPLSMSNTAIEALFEEYNAITMRPFCLEFAVQQIGGAKLAFPKESWMPIQGRYLDALLFVDTKALQSALLEQKCLRNYVPERQYTGLKAYLLSLLNSLTCGNLERYANELECLQQTESVACRQWLAINFPWTQPRKLDLNLFGCAAKRKGKARQVRIRPMNQVANLDSEQSVCSEISRRFGSTPQTIVKFVLDSFSADADYVKFSCSLSVQYKAKAVDCLGSLALFPKLKDPAKIKALCSDQFLQRDLLRHDFRSDYAVQSSIQMFHRQSEMTRYESKFSSSSVLVQRELFDSAL